MPDKLITIRVTKEIHHQDGSPRWRPGTQVHTTREELAERKVPSDSYEVVAEQKQETQDIRKAGKPSGGKPPTE